MQVPTNYEDIIKLLIVGDTAVGKTNFINQFIENKFDDNYIPSNGFVNKTTFLTLKYEKIIKLQIWETVSYEKDLSLNRSLFLKVQGIILMYDITNLDSFEHIGNWIKYIQNINDNIPIILVANKCDLYDDRIVSQKEGKDLAIKYNFTFVETSGKNNINVNTTFVKICEEIIAKAEMRMNSIDSDIMDDTQPSYLKELIPYKDKRKKKKCCCC
jgi:small GTP-binding protein